MNSPKKVSYPRISFGIIVVNGHPFTKYCLRSIYPFAYEIIVVEGGSEAARAVTTPDGHSLDGTLEALYQFKQEEDPEHKLQIITSQGHWQGKDKYGGSRTQQSRAYAERATGDYLWQVDIDEFYRPSDMQAIIDMLARDPSISAVSFMTHTFWGSPDYTADCWALRSGEAEYHRLFKWGSQYDYVRHEPPTVVNPQGQDVRSLKWVRGKELARRGIYMYHYSLLFPWQVKQKALVYQHETRDFEKIVQWAENNYFQLCHPYRVHNLYQSPSWLERFRSPHPPEIVHMMRDIEQGVIQADVRPKEDVEKLLNTWWYPFGVSALKIGHRAYFAQHRARVIFGKYRRLAFSYFKSGSRNHRQVRYP